MAVKQDKPDRAYNFSMCVIDGLENLKAFTHHQRVFDTLGNIALIAAGLYLLNAFFLFFPSLAA